jgi:hypothetical protein
MTEDDQIEVSNKLAALWPKATDVQCSLILSATARLDAACVVEAMEAYRITEEGDSDWPQIHSIIRRCCEVHERKHGSLPRGEPDGLKTHTARQMLRAKPDLCGKPEWELILRHHHACFWHYRDRAENRFKKQWPSMSQSARITLRASIDQNIANRLAADTLYCTNELISIGIEREGAVKIAAGVAKPLESLFMFLHDCMPPEVPR